MQNFRHKQAPRRNSTLITCVGVGSITIEVKDNNETILACCLGQSRHFSCPEAAERWVNRLSQGKTPF